MNIPESLLARLWCLFAVFAHVSLVVVGGGYAMLPVIEREFVDRRRWIKPEEIVDILAISQSIPGIISVNAAVFIGYRAAGFAGALVAAFGVVLPPFVIISAIAAGVAAFDPALLSGAFTGVRAAVGALILVAAVKLGRKVVASRFDWVVAVGALAGVLVFRVGVVWLIVAAAVIGLLASAFARGTKAAAGGGGGAP